MIIKINNKHANILKNYQTDQKKKIYIYSFLPVIPTAHLAKASTQRRAKLVRITCSPAPVVEQATPRCAHAPAPCTAASPTRPALLSAMPPLLTAAALRPLARSMHTAPTVSSRSDSDSAAVTASSSTPASDATRCWTASSSAPASDSTRCWTRHCRLVATASASSSCRATPWLPPTAGAPHSTVLRRSAAAARATTARWRVQAARRCGVSSRGSLLTCCGQWRNAQRSTPSPASSAGAMRPADSTPPSCCWASRAAATPIGWQTRAGAAPTAPNAPSSVVRQASHSTFFRGEVE